MADTVFSEKKKYSVGQGKQRPLWEQREDNNTYILNVMWF